jgi:hypothetical protein
MSKVVHCKREPFDVYIGRPSPWGNPFVLNRDGTRGEVIAKYRRHLWQRIRQEGAPFIAQLASLQGKTLGCFCAPKACHGEVLVKAADWAANQRGLTNDH